MKNDENLSYQEVTYENLSYPAVTYQNLRSYPAVTYRSSNAQGWFLPLPVGRNFWCYFFGGIAPLKIMNQTVQNPIGPTSANNVSTLFLFLCDCDFHNLTPSRITAKNRNTNL